jgi:UDP-GlcNAc:undecaprenyl-phosphate/decaprenyl-phosphate GlcNAc-1-phosphate transferase
VSRAALDALPLVGAGFLAAVIVSFLLTPLAIRAAPRLGMIDMPDGARRVHTKPIPRSGGLAVAASFVGVGLLGLVLNLAFHLQLPGRPVRTSEVMGLFGGVALGALIGYLDDRFELKARWQFVGQFLLAGVAILAGIRINWLPNPFGDAVIPLSDAGAIAVTALWIIGMLNSVNFVDGLDGLLGGIAFIASVTLGLIALVSDPIQPVVAILCALLAGSLLGFLPYNFNPARVFIGTAGVFSVGYALAILSVVGASLKVPVALLILGVPIIDTFWIIIRRLFARRSPFSADRGHFHHRLLDLGLSHRQAVLMIYGICTALAITSLLLTTLNGRGQISVFLIAVIAGGVLLFLLTRRAGDSLERSSYTDDPESPTLKAIRHAGEEIVGGDDKNDEAS